MWYLIVSIPDLCHISYFQVLFKANLIFKDFSRNPFIFKHFSSQYEPSFSKMGLGKSEMSRDMRFPTMWYVRGAEPQISLCIGAVWSEPMRVVWIFYQYLATDQTAFWVSKPKRSLQRLVWVYRCQNATLLVNTCHGRGQKNFSIVLVLQDEWLTIFTHPANTCTCPLKVYAIKNIRE